MELTNQTLNADSRAIAQQPLLYPADSDIASVRGSLMAALPSRQDSSRSPCMVLVTTPGIPDASFKHLVLIPAKRCPRK